MKPYFSFLLVFVFFVVSAQNKTIKQTNFSQCKKIKILNKELVFPEMTSEHERLTKSQLKTFLHKKDIAESNAKVIEKPKEETDIVVEYKEYDAKNDYTVSYSFNKKEIIFGYGVYRKIEPDGNENLENSLYFIEGRTYYSNGFLKSKQLVFLGNFGDATLLKQFEYDEKGKLIKQFNLSKIYRLTLIDVLKILEKNNLLIDFNNESVSADGISYFSAIWYKETNHGKIWFVGNGIEGFQAIIYDKNSDILIQKNTQPKKIFLFMEKWQFDDNYKGKTIKEVEKEKGIKLFVVTKEN